MADRPPQEAMEALGIRGGKFTMLGEVQCVKEGTLRKDVERRKGEVMFPQLFRRAGLACKLYDGCVAVVLRPSRLLHWGVDSGEEKHSLLLEDESFDPLLQHGKMSCFSTGVLGAR